MNDLTLAFRERLNEIDAYLELLDAIEVSLRNGPPRIGNSTITGQQQRILYSSVYLQFYNLIEATITGCILAVTAASIQNQYFPIDLSAQLRNEWIRVHAKTHASLNAKNRLKSSIEFFEQLVSNSPIVEWSVDKGGGGNWDDAAIEQISTRIGCNLLLSAEVSREAKRFIRDDRNALRLVKHLRNSLAHGNLSFAECGAGVTVSDLRDIRNRIANYLQEVVVAFTTYLENCEFLEFHRRPIVGES